MIDNKFWKGVCFGSLFSLILGITIGFLGGWGWGVRSNILPLIESTQDYMINEVQNARDNFNIETIKNREPKKRR